VLKFAIRTTETTLTVQKHFHMELLTSGALWTPVQMAVYLAPRLASWPGSTVTTSRRASTGDLEREQLSRWGGHREIQSWSHRTGVQGGGRSKHARWMDGQPISAFKAIVPFLSSFLLLFSISFSNSTHITYDASIRTLINHSHYQGRQNQALLSRKYQSL
jgi:hypothetical protein